MNCKKEKSTFAWIMEFADEKKGTYVRSVIAAIIGVACGVLPYFFVADIVTKLISGCREMDVYLKEGIAIAGLWLLRCLFHSISTTLSHKATFAVLGNIRKRVCDKLIRLPLGYVLDTPSGSLKNVMVERIDSIETTLAHVVPEFTSNLLVPVAMIVYLFVLDYRMALAVLLTIPLGMVCLMGMFRGYEESYHNTVVKTKILNDTAVEYINGIEVIKAFGKAQSSYERFVVAAEDGANCFIDWMRRCNVYFCAAMAIFPATMIGVLPIGGLLYQRSMISADTFIRVIVFSVGLVACLIVVMSYNDDLAKIRTIVGEVVEILEQEELSRPLTTVRQPVDSSISLSQVTFSYHEKEVLHGINMEISSGSVNALVGPSGSGKSTIAKLIASLWDVKDGSICIGGTDIRQMSAKDFNRMVSYVSQDNYLFNETVMDNIRMGKLDATDEEVMEAAKKCGCHEFIMGLERGYETVVGAAGGHLSGGERQRISIARAMLKDAPIVILDEATAYTDPENEAVIQASVAKLVENKTLIVIAHRLSTITDSDRIFVINKGEIDDVGTHEQLLRRHGLYEKMWEAHIAVRDRGKEGEALA